MSIAGAALAMRNARAAESGFREAVTLDPQLVDASVMLVRIQLATGRLGAARTTVDAALEANRDSRPLEALRDQLAR